jgi:FkbM family methyltransferase
MRLRSRYKDWRRRRLLSRAGIRAELDVPTVTAGARSGTWTVASDPLGPTSLVWSFGVGDDVAWELALIARFRCRVRAFDPTPAARAWLATQTLPAELAVEPVGLAAFDGEQSFAPPRRPGGVNYRPIESAGAPAGAVRAPVRRLATLAREHGVTRLDVLKLDIEGGEHAVLDDLLATGPLPAQLLVEFHHGQHGIPFARTAASIAALRSRGYRVLHVSRRGLELSFLRTDGCETARLAPTWEPAAAGSSGAAALPEAAPLPP